MSNKQENNDDSIAYWIRIGGDIIGEVTSNVISSMYSTEGGAVFAGTLGPLVGNTVQNMGLEMRNRFLSKRETQRIGSSFAFLYEKFSENISNGKHIRTDDFFNETQGEYNQNAEILEGVLLTVQKSYEEKKVRYLSYFYANILFEKRWDRLHANHFLRLAEEMSYRQFCLLAIYFEKKKFGLNIGPDEKDVHHRIVRYDTTYDIRSLGEKKLLDVNTPMGWSGMVAFQFSPKEATISDYGIAFYELFGLSKIPLEDILGIAEHLTTLEIITSIRMQSQ